VNKIIRILNELFFNEVTKDKPFSGVDIFKDFKDSGGLFELPKDKNFWDMPLSHYVDLVNKKGRVPIEGALISLRVFNANNNPDVSKRAEDIRLKLKDKFNW
jgi:hypothetical protein